MSLSMCPIASRAGLEPKRDFTDDIRGRRGKGIPLRHPGELFALALMPGEVLARLSLVVASFHAFLREGCWCHDEYEGRRFPLPRPL